jgi:hypothetical protein
MAHQFIVCSLLGPRAAAFRGVGADLDASYDHTVDHRPRAFRCDSMKVR